LPKFAVAGNSMGAARLGSSPCGIRIDRALILVTRPAFRMKSRPPRFRWHQLLQYPIGPRRPAQYRQIGR